MFAVRLPLCFLAFAATRSLSLSTLSGTSASPEFPLPACGLSFGQKSGQAKSAKPHESCQALQNVHLHKKGGGGGPVLSLSTIAFPAI